MMRIREKILILDGGGGLLMRKSSWTSITLQQKPSRCCARACKTWSASLDRTFPQARRPPPYQSPGRPPRSMVCWSWDWWVEMSNFAESTHLGWAFVINSWRVSYHEHRNTPYICLKMFTTFLVLWWSLILVLWWSLIATGIAVIKYDINLTPVTPDCVREGNWNIWV